MSTVVKDLGAVSAYAYAVEKGYTGTEAEFAELMADYAEVGQRAEDAADRAEAALDEFTSVTADATTLPEGSSATAEYSDGNLTLGIPKGDKGDTGTKGDGAVYAVIGNMASVIPVGTDGYLTSAYTITIPVTFYSGKDNVTGAVTSSDLYISRSSGGSGEMDTVPGSTYRYVKTATIIYAIPAGWRVGTGRITLTVTIGTTTLTYYHAYTIAPTGPTGNGIASVAKTGTSGLVDTYTITYTNGNTSIFTVTNGAEAVDNTLTIAGRAADAKKTGDEISELKEDLTHAFPHDTASGAVASFADGANVPVKSLIVNIDPVQSGSGDPSPTNVRPISGWDAVNANVSGINIWDEEVEPGYIAPDTGKEVVDSSKIRMKNYVPVLPNTTYYKKTPIAFWVVYFDADKEYIGYGDAGVDRTITMPDNCYYIRCGFEVTYGTTYNHDISINYPATDHDYHPYDGHSINIQLGQTVYGGKLDVLSGVLTVDMAMRTLTGADDWILDADGTSRDGVTCLRAYQKMSALKKPVGTEATRTYIGVIIASNLQTVKNGFVNQLNMDGIDIAITGYAGNQGNYLYIIVNKSTMSIRTIADLKAWLAENNVQFCYELATPLTVQLTPHEVSSLLGSNNVWADTGDSEVVYRADPTLYINKKIAEAISALS